MQRDDRRRNYNYSLDPIANEHRLTTRKSRLVEGAAPTRVRARSAPSTELKIPMAICAITRVYPRTQAARYRYFSQPAFPADPSPVQSGDNEGAPRQRPMKRVWP